MALREVRLFLGLALEKLAVKFVRLILVACAPRKILITKRNRAACLNFAKEHILV